MDAIDGKELDHRHLKSRLMGKFFGKDGGKEKKPTSPEDVSDFLHGSSDKLYTASSPTTTSTTPPRQPVLGRIDTSSARRWPTAAEINNGRRNRSASPKRSRKGLVVRFAEAQPEVIGEGGEECISPTAEISQRTRAATIPQQSAKDRRPGAPPTYGSHGPPDRFGDSDTFRPRPLQRTQTGFSTISDENISSVIEQPPPYRQNSKEYGINGSVKDDVRSPSPAKAEAAMRASEGKALVRAASGYFDNPDLAASGSDGPASPLDEAHLNTMRNTQLTSPPGVSAKMNTPRRPETPSDSGKSSPPAVDQSPSVFSRASTSTSINGLDSPPSVLRTPTFNLREAAVAVSDDALQEFSMRTSHMYSLFRLSAESIKPLTSCSLDELIRGALWWFLRGRLNLETAIRDRSTTSEAQQNNYLTRQQAYTDLTKSYWLTEKIATKCPELSGQQNSNNNPSNTAEALECRQAILSGLRKLTMVSISISDLCEQANLKCQSMKRNNFLPPEAENAPLTQGVDNSIWVRDDGNRDLLSLQRPKNTIPLSGALPLGDSNSTFTYGRYFTEAYLTEDADPQHYSCPCVISVVRRQNEEDLRYVITNQTGTLTLCVQDDKTRGPTWNDLSWIQKNNCLDIKLPRGFMLRLRLTQQDFRSLRGAYDLQNSLRESFCRLEDEEIVFEMTVKAFQCFGQEKNSQSFPPEVVPKCEVRLFEKSSVEKAATGPRKRHRGFRLAVLTGKTTKNFRGINQEILPTNPIYFNFLRGDNGLPALLLKADDGRSRTSMVFTFDEVEQRSRFHAVLTSSAVGREETAFAEASIRSFGIEESASSTGLKRLTGLEWQGIRVINEDALDIQNTKTVLSEHLRVIMDFRTGTLTDRFNIGQGELKIRLDVHSPNELKILRQPQQDMTIVATQPQAPNQSTKEFADVLRLAASGETTRTYVFPSPQELHLFQAALTGYVVLFDGRALSFNIARRRMVVPIYKKWDAAVTRLQVVQKEKVVQLIAFFEGFSHGDCMGFTLKSTDVFETSNKGGKFSLRIVDAKFAMPKPRGEGQPPPDNGFVNLDMPDYPGEHDDITIVFDTDTERDTFTKALPAPVKVASRMASVRR
ncbi:putative trans-sulfuration enzyme protein [Rutstroemia sp. NJR-2017a WRK4]|nr:putative trans-sulfuration enzyme protein [Rutstroemia sp. NJR-2017a WRK4]